VGALAALIVWLIGTLHGFTPPCGEGDRYSSARMKSSWRRARRSIVVRSWFGYGSATAPPRLGGGAQVPPGATVVSDESGVRFHAFSACRLNSRSGTNAEFSSPVDKPWSVAAGEHQKSLWITSGLVVFCLCANSANRKISQDLRANDSTLALG
jgi:hypothetical protein